MNRPSESAPRRRLHPLLGAAAVSVIILSAVAVAAMTGVLPNLSAGSSPQAAASAQEAALAGPEAANVASAPQQAPKQAQKPAQSAQPAQQPAQAGAPACATCGVVEGIRTVQVPVRDDSNHLIGTVAGGVVGGVVGNQFGGGHGRDALTVLGAVGGALTGREVERNIREQQTVTHYELTVRMSDGSRRQFRSAQPFAFASGDRVRVENDQLLPG